MLHLRWQIIQAVEAFMTDFDTDPERQADTFLLGEVTERLRIEQNKFSHRESVDSFYFTGAAVRETGPLRR